MVTISNIDLVMAALRSRLQRIAADKRTGKARPVRSFRLGRNEERDRIAALAAMRHLPEEDFDRALVRVMLETELGDEVAADSRFQHIVEHTTRVLRDSPELRGAFRRIQSGKD